jgi:hypothetical protein
MYLQFGGGVGWGGVESKRNILEVGFEVMDKYGCINL